MKSWNTLQKFYKEGKCKAIGVSNYSEKHLEELKDCEVQPAVNQVEFNTFLYQKDLLAYHNAKGIKLQGYSPLSQSFKLEDERVIAMGKKYKKSAAQLLIRWCVQH